MSKEALAKVVQRSISDAAFRRQLATDPSGALRGYDLSGDEKSALRSGDPGRLSAFGVEQREALAKLPFFKGLDATELDRIVPRLVAVKVAAGAAVFHEGDPGDRYYLIREGEAQVSIGGKVVAQLGPGAGFGDLALLTGRPRTATVVAQTELSLAALGRREFGWLVHASGETVGEFRARTAHYGGSAGLGAAVRGA